MTVLPGETTRATESRLNSSVYRFVCVNHHGLAHLGMSSHRETAVAESVVVHAPVEFHNRADLDVLQRVQAYLIADDTTEREWIDAGGAPVYQPLVTLV
ncbi:hypothetical protein [Streptomyces sp. NPDC007117]|uniref:hypothetical protein n=1 Tax=Streptomyces sp. NPDC007117 TaxID=3154314 RepID=UPI003403558A